MADITGKVKYSGDLLSMRKLVFCLREEGLQVTIARSEERRDIGAAIIAVLAIAGSVDGVIDLLGRIRAAIRKYRELQPNGDEIEIVEPDDGGFLQ